MSFAVTAHAYDRFMGRYSVPLAPKLADLAGFEAGQRVLDVGCGPGALTAELVGRLGAHAVAAVDPSEPFVEAARQRYPGVTVQRAAAESLPFGDAAFDAALAELVVHFMADPGRRAARDGAGDESRRTGSREGHLAQLFTAAGLREVEESALSVDVDHPTFDESRSLGVGPAGGFTASLDAEGQARLRGLCRERLPAPPFTVTARTWAARGLAH